jgi:hypothetical protein
MPVFEAQVVMPRVTGLPEDVIVNTFHFFVPVTYDIDDLVAIHGRLVEFYNNDPAGGDGIHAYLSHVITRSTLACNIKFYDLEEPSPRAPVYEQSWTLAAPAGSSSPLPSEVALCLSYRGALVSGEVAARRRGRVYIGPLITEAKTTGTSDPRPTTNVINRWLDAGEALADPDAVSPWVVWSPTANANTLIEVVWVDNAFDTQRRRGPDATDRTSRTIT